MNIVGILLAAGRGERFDPSGVHNKLLQPVAGQASVAAASARAMLAVLPRVIAVVPDEGGDLAQVLRNAGCEVTGCPDAGQGMGASLVHAVRHSLPGADGWIIALADMPYVEPSTIAALHAAIAAGAGIAAPFYDGQRGNPVAFGAGYLQQLLALAGDYGARSILAANVVTAVVVNDPGILHDIDTPSDLDKPGTLPVGGQAEKS